MTELQGQQLLYVRQLLIGWEWTATDDVEWAWGKMGQPHNFGGSADKNWFC